MAFDNIRKKLGLMQQEEIEGLSEPSIMDSYIKENDPEQYDKIQQAKSLKLAQEAGPGLGGAMGTIKSIGSNAEGVAKDLAKADWLQNISPGHEQRVLDVVKQRPMIDPNYQRLTLEEIQRLRSLSEGSPDDAVKRAFHGITGAIK